MKHLNEVLRLLKTLLGPSRKIKDEYAFRCPFCKHKKFKLQVSPHRGLWNCWACPAKGRSLFTLFKSVGCDVKILKRVSEITGGSNHHESSDADDTVLYLPPEFKSVLDDDGSLDYKHARYYLKKRGLTREDFIKYNIGYCVGGAYDGRIVIPSYDASGTLNYFVARAFYNVSYKYKNPPASRNAIIFDLHINWNEPITICEGVFDAMAVRSNAIPILGKFIPSKLHDKILQSGVPEIRIALDLDARTDALKIANRYMKQGFNVKLLDLTGKDPSEIGFHGMGNVDRIDMGFKSLMTQKILNA